MLFPSSSAVGSGGKFNCSCCSNGPTSSRQTHTGAAHALGGRCPWGPTLTHGDGLDGARLAGPRRGEPSVQRSVRPWHGAASPDRGRAGQWEKPQHHTWLWETVSRGWGPGSVASVPALRAVGGERHVCGGRGQRRLGAPTVGEEGSLRPSAHRAGALSPVQPQEMESSSWCRPGWAVPQAPDDQSLRAP